MGKKKKNDSFYYDNFNDCAALTVKAAKLLDETMRAFDPQAIEGAVQKMHGIEQAADEKNHEVSDALMTAFITPIEREDIDVLSDALDDVVDALEGVLHRIYFDNIQAIRPDALEISAMVVRETEAMADLVKEFPQFKHPKRLHEQIIAINKLEEEADGLYIQAMRQLHTTDEEPLTVIAWRDVYTFLEYCSDAVEDVARTIDGIVMKNS